MKKIFALLMIGALVLMTGCGSGTADVNETSTDVAQASPVAKNIPKFTAKTIYGDTVTEEIFAAKKITVVNIWGTFCPPCIAEMPELGEMARSLPADAQIIGLVCDAEENSAEVAKAQEIVKQSNVSFVNIVPDANLQQFMENVTAVPTTIFVNSKGEVVGKAILGADVAGYKAELSRLLK